MLEEKEEEGMGVAVIRYGETDAFIQHIDSQLWLSYQTSEVTKKGLGAFRSVGGGGGDRFASVRFIS